MMRKENLKRCFCLLQEKSAFSIVHRLLAELNSELKKK